jgi:CheY-like chemotaxis protein
MSEDRMNNPQSAIRNQKSILIIDDNADDILLTQRALMKIDGKIRIETATSGVAGLAMLRDGRQLPALILLDMKMTGMSGLDVLRAIRGDRRLGQIPVMMVTHSELEADRTASLESGANGFFHKDIDLDEFKKGMECLLERWVGC